METDKQSSLAEAMQQLWTRFLPQLEERVTALEDAAAALASGTLASELRKEACSAAHKLAGVLGTFGLAEGTQLAREAETIYGGNSNPDTAEAARLAEIAAQLKAMLAGRR